ncbi:MAG: molybdopterin-dependent oxidoreductase, partial [Desulfobulbaceae bacterium]|nr:molybdopterin-dependent oxidoreductase [Desulfobulbaceae bacterium]HIJ91082.1 molybdopterin-dependent oxidoreductase [Deltaproteobacteria bacterium]
PLRGQNNVQGACDMGALPNMLPSYQTVNNQDYREKFERAWGAPLPEAPGMTLVDMTHAGVAGPIRAMYIMGENPMLSDPTLSKVEETLRGLDFLAVSDIFLSETARLAHVVFPAACFAEKSGTFTNSERRVQMVRQAVAPPGECRADSEIIMELSGRLGHAMNYDSSAEVMEEIALLSPIYGGMYHDRLEQGWGLQWPCWDRDHPGTPFLHKYYFTRGRGHFVPAGHTGPGELPDLNYPLLLMTGRIYHHYHTGTMTRRSARLTRECDHAVLQINPVDATSLALRQGEMLRLVSRRGEITLAASISDQVAPGMVYTTFHFHETPVNLLTNDAFDTGSRCPEYKVCAVRVEKLTGP